jgi:TRAP-type C4-dicarboxylate transport system permease large subunit
MKILEAMRSFITNKYLFLFVLNIFLLIVGCLMDIFSAIIVVVPLILPIAEQFGVNPLHLAVVFLTNLEIGYITPPVGINLFISSYRFNRSVIELYKLSIPYLILMILALILITYIPWLSLIWF